MSAVELLAGSPPRSPQAVRDARASAPSALVEASLARIAATDARVNAFTDVTAERALRARRGSSTRRLARRRCATRAAAARRAVRGQEPVRRRRPDHAAPARRSSATRRPPRATRRWCARLEAAGAVLVGALNMDEYAYGFTTENTHDGPTRNPHDLDAHRRRLVGRLGARRSPPARCR